MQLSLDNSAARIAAWLMRRTTASALRRVAPVSAAIGTDIGSVRQDNEDRVAIARAVDASGAPFVLALLADGIGGLKAGAECASLALGTFIDAIAKVAKKKSKLPDAWLREAAFKANGVVYDRYSGNGGCTLVALLFAEGHPPCWLSVGDSRVYQYSGEKLEQLSKDDTLDGQLGRAAGGERRSELLQFVGIGNGIEPHVEYISWNGVGENGSLFLTSDGVHFVEHAYVEKVIYFSADNGVGVRRLIDLAKMLGAPDNASVVAVGFDALAVSAADQSELLSDVVEVWDAFGELQILSEPIKRSLSSMGPVIANANIGDSSYERYVDDHRHRVTYSAESTATDDALSEVVSEKTPRVSKRARPSKRGKAKGASPEGAAVGVEEPQLDIEFRKK